MKYQCSKCGEFHDSWPALAFNTPHPYHCLTDEEKKSITEIDDDFCVIRNPDQTDRFIRVVLRQKVNDEHCEPLEYGVWTSLSEKSFSDYKDHFKTPDHEAGYFGYLSSHIPEYDDRMSIRLNVVTGKGNDRPEVLPQDDQMDVPFVRDYYNGISKEEAERRISEMMSTGTDHTSGEKEKKIFGKIRQWFGF